MRMKLVRDDIYRGKMFPWLHCVIFNACTFQNCEFTGAQECNFIGCKFLKCVIQVFSDCIVESCMLRDTDLRIEGLSSVCHNIFENSEAIAKPRRTDCIESLMRHFKITPTHPDGVIMIENSHRTINPLERLQKLKSGVS